MAGSFCMTASDTLGELIGVPPSRLRVPLATRRSTTLSKPSMRLRRGLTRQLQRIELFELRDLLSDLRSRPRRAH
jgi:hypothetical protein